MDGYTYSEIAESDCGFEKKKKNKPNHYKTYNKGLAIKYYLLYTISYNGQINVVYITQTPFFHRPKTLPFP